MNSFVFNGVTDDVFITWCTYHWNVTSNQINRPVLNWFTESTGGEFMAVMQLVSFSSMDIFSGIHDTLFKPD